MLKSDPLHLVGFAVFLLLEAGILFCWLAGLTQIASWPWRAALHLLILSVVSGLVYGLVRLILYLRREAQRVARVNTRKGTKPFWD